MPRLVRPRGDLRLRFVGTLLTARGLTGRVQPLKAIRLLLICLAVAVALVVVMLVTVTIYMRAMTRWGNGRDDVSLM